MINSLCGSLGTIKSENSCTKPQPTSPNESVISECTKKINSNNLNLPLLLPLTSQLSDFDQTISSSQAPPSLKFEIDGDIEIQSPVNTSMWESFFSDHPLDGDFMISSPVRPNLPSSPQNNNYSVNQALLMQGAERSSTSTLSGCSPPRNNSSQLGAFSSTKGKLRMSPLHRVFNSPNDDQFHYMQSESLSSLPAIRELLEDYSIDTVVGDDASFDHGLLQSCYNTTAVLSSNGLNHDFLQAVESNFDSRFSCGGGGGGSDQVGRQEGGIYGRDHDHEMGGSINNIIRGGAVPLSQQLQQEHEQEKQQLQHNNVNHSLMVPLPSDQQEQDSGLQLVHLLLACAEAVAKDDYLLARRYLHHLNRIATPLGDSMQRVASCFTEALGARLAATVTTITRKPSSSTLTFPPNPLEILKIYQIVYQACPYIKFAHFTANQAIFETFEAEERVHVIDLDILQGYQWPAFMQALAARPSGAPFLRITGVGTSIESVRETGRCLTELAHSLNVPFEFHAVGEQLEDLKPNMFNRRVGEALAVNSVNRLHRVPGNCLGNLLTMIRDQAPNIVTLVEQEASHNGPYFLGRFLEALHYYSAIFDSLDATFPPDSAQRAKVEQYIFGPEIRNIVAFEGAERIERHERLEKWRKIMEGRGFKGVTLSANAVTQSKILLGLYSCDGYRLTEDKGCLVLGWQDRALIAASAWRC